MTRATNMFENAVAAFRVTFQRPLDDGESLAKFQRIPRNANGWPVERNFKKWPIADQEAWVEAPIIDFLEDGLTESNGDASAPEMRKAWREIGEYLKHVGIELEKLGDKSARDAILDHYRSGSGYDCEQSLWDFETYPPIAARIRFLRREQRVKDEHRRTQKNASKRRRRSSGDSSANDFGKING